MRNSVALEARPRSSPQELLFLTLNLGGDEDREARDAAISSWIKQKRQQYPGVPIIGACQEGVQLPEKAGREEAYSNHNSVENLSQSLDFKYVQTAINRHWRDSIYGAYNEGLAFISDIPIIEEKVIPLTRAKGDPHERFLYAVRPNVSLPLWLVNVHVSIADPPPDFATPQIQETFEKVQELDAPAIVLGDFNRDPRRAAGKLMNNFITSKEVFEAESGQSYVTQYDAIGAHGRVNRDIDQICIPRFLHFVKGSIEISPAGLSDHRAVIGKVALGDG